MARRSTRNLLRAMASALIDDRSIGPNVSDNIQLVYLVDDLQPFTSSHHGGGGPSAAAAGEHGTLQLICNADTRIEAAWLPIDHLAGAIPGEIVLAWSNTLAGAPAITGAAVLVPSLTDGPGPTDTLVLGTVPTATIPAAPMAFAGMRPGLQGFFVSAGQVLTICLERVNTATHLGLRWTELNRS